MFARRFTPIAILIASGTAFAAPLRATTRPIPAISRTLIVSIDGLRPDLMLRAETPTIRALLERGTFSLWARTTPASVTILSHISMLTGVSPAKHRIEWNTDLPLTRPIWPARPTLFELAKDAGLTTAMIAGKSKFSVLAKPGSLDWVFVPKEPVTTDAIVADSASAILERHAPRVVFVHLPEVDSAGHTYGWGSPEQIAAIEAADLCLGRILEAVRARGLLDSTFVLVTTDHGGAGKTHGPDDPRSRHIPWIAAGPGIRPNHDLTTNAESDVRTEDTFATVCWLLGIEAPMPIDSHPVIEIRADP